MITCTTCGGQVQDTAVECPACGTPTGVEPPERPKRWKKYALISAGVLLAAGIVALVARKGDPPVKKEQAVKAAQPVAKAPQPEAPKLEAPKRETPKVEAPVVEAAKPPPEPVAKAPQQQVAKLPPHGVYFLAVYTASEGRELLRELRPVVAPDESAMNEFVNRGSGARVYRPLGLACGPDRGPFYAWVFSRDPTPQPNFRVGGACGFPSLTAAAQRAMEGCRESGGCKGTDTEIQLYAADVRDGAGEEWRAKPRLFCQFAAGNILTAWQYGAQKADFNAACAALL